MSELVTKRIRENVKTRSSFLDLSKCDIRHIPAEISECVWLKSLWLHDNPLISLDSIKTLEKLQRINISNTDISDISLLGAFFNLEVVDISHTKVSSLSPIFHMIKKGIEISGYGGIRIDGCPITSPPLEIIREGHKAILSYIEQLETVGSDQIFEAKLLIIGEGGAGKTSLSRKFFDPLAELPKEQDSTQGIDIRPLYFSMPNGKQFRLNIWDFAGQGKYQSAHSFFYTHRSLYVLVDDTRTLDENEAYRTFYYHWLQIVELFGGDSPLLVLHNQKANRHRTGFNLGSFQAIFPFVKDLFRINLGENDTKGIIELKQEIERWAQKLPHIGDVVPKTWVYVRNEIEEERQQRPYISDERYRDICIAHGINDDEKQLELSRYFHDLGVFLHFQENPLLRRDIFLQNEWVTSAVYKILDDTTIEVEKRGRFDKNDLINLWSEGYHARRRDELLALMLQFELCYKVQDLEIYVAPQLLPGDIPEYDLGVDLPLQIKYEYGFMPKGLLYRLIVRLHRHIAQKQLAVWNGGVVLERTGALADIVEWLNRRQILVRATGLRKKELITIINEEVEKLHDTYGDRLKVETKIPCNCEICKESETPHFYDKKRDLDNRLLREKRTVECPISFDAVDVQGLLDGVFTEVLGDRNHQPVEPYNIKIFLASSSELKSDRDDFELYFRRLNDHLKEEKSGTYLKIVRWENFLDAMSETRFQDEYNKEIQSCDIFVSLFFTKTGKYTEEEFNVAHQQFKNTGKPKIFTFFKKPGVVASKDKQKDLQSLWAFQEKLDSLGHFYTNYDNIEHLKRQFRDQLDQLLREGRI